MNHKWIIEYLRIVTLCILSTTFSNVSQVGCAQAPGSSGLGLPDVTVEQTPHGLHAVAGQEFQRLLMPG